MVGSFPVIAELMVRAQDPRIYTLARGIVSVLVSSMIGRKGVTDSMNRRSFEYELDCWVDGLSLENMSGFAALLKDSTSQSLNCTILAARALSKSGLPIPIPGILFSPLIPMALGRRIQKVDSLFVLSMQVALKCLVAAENPLPRR